MSRGSGRRHRRPPIGALRLAVAAALIWAGILAAPGRAVASCAVLPGAGAVLDLADVVLVGTVTTVVNQARWATVRVEEVWKGPDQPLDVIVQGGPGGNAATSVDRTYVVGTRYLFALSVSDGNLVDNACTATTPADAIDLAGLRPADARSPIGAAGPEHDPGPDLGGVIGPVAVAALVAGLLIVVVAFARRRAT